MRAIVLILMFSVSKLVSAQPITIDTLKNAIASINTYTPIPVYGRTGSGGLYGAGLNFIFSQDGKPLPVQFVRIDFAKKKVTYKTLPDVISNRLALWITAFDAGGNLYVSLKTNPKKVIRFNLKDSIQYRDLGNPFLDNYSWAYCMSLGRDGKMYFGGSNTSTTNWTIFDPKTNSFEKHPSIDPNNDFVLSIAGDSNYVYAQTGQRNSVQLWSIRKKDDYKKCLGKISNTARIGLETTEDGIYALFRSDTLTGWFKLLDGDTVRVTKSPDAKRILYEEVNNNLLPKINSVFDPGKSKLFYSLDSKLYDSISIATTSVRMPIRKLFSFPNDRDDIYFAGDYYSNYYRYNLKTNTLYLLGNTGYNIYSSLALNDSIMFFGGYPSGYLMKWNRNQPWTTEKFVEGKLVAATDPKANPRILGFWKSTSKPPAGFHHTEQLIFDAFNNVVGAGDVIRIGSGASIGVYNPSTDSMYGIAYKAYSGMGYRSIARWKQLIIYAMDNEYGKKPKLYFYNSIANKMVDSLDLGYDDYGNIFVQGDILTGIARNRQYKLDLSLRKVIDTCTYPSRIIRHSYFLRNGKAIIKIKSKLPRSILDIVSLDYDRDFLELNGYVYAVTGNYIVRIKGLSNN